MSEERIKIIPTRVLWSQKTGKTVLSYNFDYVESENVRGYSNLIQTFPGRKLFYRIKKDYINDLINATYHYKKTFNGNARFELTDLFDENGVSLLD